MGDYKINRKKPDLPDDKINKHKDFAKIMAGHQKILKYKDATKPLYKNPGLLGLMVTLSVVLLLFIITEKEKEEKPKNTDSLVASQKTQEIKAEEKIESQQDTSLKNQVTSISKGTSENIFDFKKLGVKFSSFSVDPKKGAMIYTNDTRILIPSDAFVDEKGSLITEDVRIDYRVFRDPVEFFLSGIPMHYDSENGGHNLESAGMFEIRGFSSNKPIFINKAITVELTASAHSGYNTYYYEETSKKWIYGSKENVSMRFMVQADEKEFPELKPFKDLVWEFTVNAQQKDPNEFRHIFSKTWSSFFIDEGSTLTTKNVKLKQNTSEPKFLAHPVALLNDKDANQKLIQAKFDEYYKLKKKKEIEAKAFQDALTRQQAWLTSPQGKAYINWAKSAEGQRSILSSRIVNIFSIENFGIWNCDKPVNLPKGASLTASFVDENNNSLNLAETCLIDYSINSTFKYYKGVPISFNPKSSNVLWAALPGGKIAVYDKEKFKSIIQKDGEYKFVMKVIDINGKDINQVKEILGIKNHITEKVKEKEQNPIATYERIIQMEKAQRANDILYKDTLNSITMTGNIFKPTFKGGEKALQKFIRDNIRVPKEAKENTNMIVADFTVSKYGKISNIRVLKSANCQACAEEILRLIASMPDWIPAHKNGSPIDSKANIQIMMNDGLKY